MKLIQLEYLVALNKYGSLSRAAEHLYVAQPTVSLAIKDLENELGYPLIVRSNRGVTFTEQGKAVLQRAGFIMQNVASIQSILPDQRSVTGTVKIGCTPPHCKSTMLELHGNLRQSYPGIHLSIQGANSREILRMIQNGEYQLGIIHLEDVDASHFYAQVERGDLVYGELQTEPLAVMAGAGHPLAHKKTVKLQELLDYEFVTPSKNVNPYLCQYYEKAGRGNLIVSINEVCTVRRYLCLSTAIAAMPLRSALDGNDLFAEKLVPLQVEGMHELCTVCWIHGKYIDEAAKKVLEILLTQET